MPPAPPLLFHLRLEAADLAVKALTRRFGNFVAVDHVSFSVGRREVFDLIGANGAGKSTIVRMLTTLLPVSSGGATVAGYDLVRKPGEIRSRIEQGLAATDLASFAHRLVKGFSGGMILRLEIAQGLLHRPAILFLDEPTVGLDPAARHAVLDRLRKLRAETATTILLTSLTWRKSRSCATGSSVRADRRCGTNRTAFAPGATARPSSISAACEGPLARTPYARAFPATTDFQSAVTAASQRNAPLSIPVLCSIIPH